LLKEKELLHDKAKVQANWTTRQDRYHTICDICGALLDRKDIQARNFIHLNGRIHKGYAIIRDTIGEFEQREKMRIAARDLGNTLMEESSKSRSVSQLEGHDIVDKLADKTRSRSHSMKTRKRSWRRRSKSRSREHRRRRSRITHSRNGLDLCPTIIEKDEKRSRSRRRRRRRPCPDHRRRSRSIHRTERRRSRSNDRIDRRMSRSRMKSEGSADRKRSRSNRRSKDRKGSGHFSG